jgi:type IV pilus assembly protein PilM
MIKEIFLPEKTKTRRLISKRIVGLSIQELYVSATQVYATPRTTSIERLHEEPLAPGAPSTYQERVSLAIKATLSKLSRYDQIIVSIPSTIVTFKELTLPFTDIEKIRMVIEYEVEAMLPFSLQESIIDFIITNQDPSEKTSQLLVAAVRKQDLQNTFDICKLAGIDPNIITVDLFALYGLYLQIPEYKELQPATALIDIGATSTSIAFLLNGQMRLIRNISRGLSSMAEHISEETKTPLNETIQNLISFGKDKPDDPTFGQAAQKHITSFLTDIQFTLNSFSLKLNFYENINKILFTGDGTEINGFIEFAKNLLQIPCEQFSCDKLFQTKHFKNKTKKLISNWTKHTTSLGTAISYAPHDQFNLRKKEFAVTTSPLLTKQLITAAILIVSLFTVIGIRGFVQIRSLKSIVTQRKLKAISNLKKIFPPRHPARKKTELRALFRSSQQMLSQREQAWEPFLQENLQPLQILKDLSQTMDRRTFNITIEKTIIDLDEQGEPQVHIVGIFASQPGKHFSDYENFVKYFEQNSKLLTIKERDEDMVDNEGAKFDFKLKVKEHKNHE